MLHPFRPPYSLWIALFFSAGHLSASLISWEFSQPVTSSSEIITTGTLVSAVNEGGATVTLSGAGGASVEFTGGSSFGSGANGLLGGGDTGDNAFNTLLDTVSFGGGSGTTSFDLGAFTPGESYHIQIFFSDQRSSSRDRVMTFGGSTGGATVDLEADPDNTTGSPFGSYALGVFTADGVDPDLTLTPNGFGNSHINAYQIRSIGVVPEPTTLGLIGLGTLALLRRLRK